jgi:predicted small lipoprotein YifL
MRPPFLQSRSCLSFPLIAIVGLMLVACGQSGGLYLPDKEKPEASATSAPAAPAAAPATPGAVPDEEEEKKEESQGAPAPPATTTSPSTTLPTP